MLTRASLRHYAGTNALVVIGVAAAVAVLAGALLVGDSVRESLRRLALARLGAADTVVTAPLFFRSALAGKDAAPLIVAAGAVTHTESNRTAGRVAVYGIDDRFAAFHGVTDFAVTGREAMLSAALAAELGARAGDAITLKIAKPTDIPLSTLQGRRESPGERIRLTVSRVFDRGTLGDFSLAPSQGPALSIFVPLKRLQDDLSLGDRVNTLLEKGAGDLFPKNGISLDDLGLRTRNSGSDDTVIESRAGLITDALAEKIAETATRNSRQVRHVLTYVANAIKTSDREIPYSTISAIDFTPTAATTAKEKDPRPLLWLNEWAAKELGAKVGDDVGIEYYVWTDEDGLETRSAQFALAGIVPMNGIGGDQTLTPEYPGISDAEDITAWDPPFPVDLKRVGKRDEDYWDHYRGAPKAIISLADGQQLWGSRYGKVSSLRLSGTAPIDARAIDPAAAGFTARNVRADAIAASQGTTDFGEYFLYFSFFLVVSALLLAYLFFAVGLEQRTTEVGILAAIGFSPRSIRRLFVREGAVLATIGALAGIAAAIGYSAIILYGLRTWWIGAVGTTDLSLHVAPQWLAAGAIGALIVGFLALWIGIRAMSRRSARALLKGAAIETTPRARAMTMIAAATFAVIGSALLATALAGAIDATGGFFGAGGAYLVGGLFAASILLRRRPSTTVTRTRGLLMLGLRHTSVRPARSVLSLALIAFATFVLVSVGAFKKDVSTEPNDPSSGTGGFALMAESIAPLMHDPNSATGRDALNLESDDPILAGTSIVRLRLRPGDEASCLALYRPANPRIIAPEPRFFERPRFSFAASMAESTGERANPWLLLNRTFDDGAVPAIADQTTLMYSLHLGVGDMFTFTPDGHAPVTLRIVGALADSVLQSELIIGEAAFVKLFPRHEGYRVWMIDAPSGRDAAIATHLEDRLSDAGLDVTDTHQRWASYHQVENTYLATFQALGALGLLLGTVGLGAVLARNILERRREIGLLRAVGFSPADIRTMALSEGVALAAGGLVLGTICALVAIFPALRDRSQALPVMNVIGLLIGVMTTAVIASLAAIRIASRTPVTQAIKTE